MNAINAGIKLIKERMPLEILNLRYMTNISLLPGKVTTLEEQIRTIVIKGIVAWHTNVVGGMSFTIPVDSCAQYNISYNPTANYLVIDVPYELTNNKEILSVHTLTYAPFNNTYPAFNTSPASMLSEKAMDALDSNVGGIVTSNLELIGPNTILVHENIMGGVSGYLRVVIENDEEFRNIKPRYHRVFADLCLAACKGDIYNKLVIELDAGYIYGGHNLNKVMDIVESYEGAWEEFDELLKEKWMKVAFMNDDEQHSNYIKSLINPIL